MRWRRYQRIKAPRNRRDSFAGSTQEYYFVGYWRSVRCGRIRDNTSRDSPVGILRTRKYSRSILFESKERPQTSIGTGRNRVSGPSIVTQLLSAGDDVTLFNRGRTNPSLFPQLEKIRGNRSAKKSDEDLSGLSRGRWDLVVDVWPNDPFIVESAARLLAPRVGQYLYVSSVAAYDGYPKANMDETSPLRPWTEATRDYDHNKAESERRLGGIVRNKLLIVRPGPIKGRRDDNPMDLVTWLLRARNQGTHIAPGDKDQAVEIVDVEDVALSSSTLQFGGSIQGHFNSDGQTSVVRLLY